MDKLLFTAEEVAQLLGIGRTRVYELMWAGRLASVKIGACRRIPADALSAYMASLTDAAA